MDFKKDIVTALIEVEVLNVGVTEFPLGSLPNLLSAKGILQIEAYHVGQVTNAPSGKATINTPVFNKSYLRLIDHGQVEYRAIPLISLNKSNGTNLPVLNVPQIDPQKSKIVVGNTAGLALNEVFLFAITYEK